MIDNSELIFGLLAFIIFDFFIIKLIIVVQYADPKMAGIVIARPETREHIFTFGF